MKEGIIISMQSGKVRRLYGMTKRSGSIKTKSDSLRSRFFSVGKTGFEPATPWSQTRCATGLRYFPNGYFKYR